MTEHIKPCPFCGNEDQDKFSEYDGRLGCDHCGTLGPAVETPWDCTFDEVIAAWNYREGEKNV